LEEGFVRREVDWGNSCCDRDYEFDCRRTKATAVGQFSSWREPRRVVSGCMAGVQLRHVRGDT
jgi:hypothetical protein